MEYFKDAMNLVNHAKQTIPRIREAYDDSLTECDIKPALLIEIKNLMENLRSALDYSAHGLFNAYGSSSDSNPRIYFPYARLDQTQTEFQSANRIEASIPGITASRPDIVSQLENYQHYSDPSNRWLPLFMELNNQNKHQQLTPQTRHERQGLRIESRGTAIELGPGASIDLGTGTSISISGARIPGGQQISGDNPAQIQGDWQQTVLVWVSFIFDSNGEEALPFLEMAVAGTEAIVTNLAAY